MTKLSCCTTLMPSPHLCGLFYALQIIESVKLLFLSFVGAGMAYQGGTVAARECISKLKQLGALVDVYSHEWLTANPDFYYCSTDDLEKYQQKSNNLCVSHLLIVSTSLDQQAVGDLLTAAHPGFEAIFGESSNYHKPDFVFINLATQQILCIALGRKNYFFGFAIDADNVKIHDGNVYDSSQPWRHKDSEDPTLVFMREFRALDYAGIVENLIESLYEFGVHARAWDHLPLIPEQIEEIINAGPDSDGLYDIDDELMTLDEARAVIAEFEEADEMGKDHLHTLQQFFPELTWGDLNTQDY